MYLSLMPFFNKEECIIDTNKLFENDGDFETHVHQYYSNFGFHLHPVDDSFSKLPSIIATVRGIFFDCENILCDGVDIEELCDYIGTGYTNDIIRAIGAFKNSKIPSDFYKIESICYLSTVYVHPQYRNKGVGSYIFKNLQEHLKYIIGKKCRCCHNIPMSSKA